MVKNMKNFASGLIVPSNLPNGEKYEEFHCDG
jgi:hypothetical protein